MLPIDKNTFEKCSQTFEVLLAGTFLSLKQKLIALKLKKILKLPGALLTWEPD